MIRCARAVLLGAGLALWAGAALAQGADETAPDPSPIPKAPPGVAHAYDGELRTDTFELPLAAAGEDGSELDYMVRMKAGETLTYSWRVEGGADGDAFYSDFHGATALAPPMEVMSYKEGEDRAAAGSLIAPFDGVHGWLFKNDAPKPVTVKLTIAGFYELRSVRETMGIGGPEYRPFGPPGWEYRYGPPEPAKP
jgi:hypothetical protein